MEKKDNKQIERPLVLELNDGKREIFEAISEVSKRRKIPFFLLEYILSEALHEVREGAKNEIAQANLFYERHLSEQQNKPPDEKETTDKGGKT